MQVNVRTRLVGLVLLSIALAGAQITITPDEVPQTPGDTYTYKLTIDTALVNVGTAGGPQVWDFDTAAFVGTIGGGKLVDPTTTPLFQYFPMANIAAMSAATETVQAYEYLSVNATEYMEYGGGTVSPDTQIFQVWDPALLVHPLPLNYNDEWLTNWAWCDTMGEFVISMQTWGRAACDAWGTANLPCGSVPCLRMNSYDSTIATTWYQGQLVNCDTFGVRLFRWHGENMTYLARASGAEDDTSQNFTVTTCYSVLADFGSGIADRHEAAPVRALSVSPNPFTGSTRLNFTTLRPGAGTVRIYDQSGSLVRVLGPEQRAVGRHSVLWDGTDAAGNQVAPGVYCCTVTDGAAAGRCKLVLSH